MDPSSLQQHHQEIMASQSLDSMLVCTKQENQLGQQQEEEDQKKPRPPDEVLKCPRCDSTNTKFCYYNNYSLSQPRYFCKSCRRYWTKGGTLRNVPVGGGCRKNRRSSSSSSRRSNSTPDDDDHHHQPQLPISSSSSSPTSLLLSPYDHHHYQHDHHQYPLSTNDLTLAFARMQKQQVGGSMGFDHHENHGNISNFDLFGNSFIDPQSNGIQHLYYGIGGRGSLGIVENDGGNNVNVNVSTHHQHHHHDHHDQMGIIPFDHHNAASSGSSTPTEIKHELGENRVLWGFPWQLSNGDQLGNNYINGGGVISGNDQQLDSLKESWNINGSVLGSASWHSLLNSPLM